MRHALVLGLGESGLAMARWLAREAWDVRVADTREDPPMLGALRAQMPQPAFLPGAFEPSLLDGVDLLAVSPGLSLHQDPVRTMIAAAAERGIETVGEIELFARALEQLRRERGYAPAIAGVTGTNGKTTTVRMLGTMIERWGRSVRVAGNVSPSALDSLREALEADRLPDFWVLELSSFQLATTTSLACTAAAVLNVTEDHLDWHGSLADYLACKARIFATRTVRVLNRDDPAVLALGSGDRGRTGAGKARRESAGAPTLGFGAGAPEHPGEFGLVRDGGLHWLACADDEDAPPRVRRSARPAPGQPVEERASAAPGGAGAPLAVHRLMPVDALAVRGTHNAMNALAALALARALGVPLAPALRALEGFRADAHRTETVAHVEGVEYVDDSKGTNVGATVAALRGLSGAPDMRRRIVVILGGEGKGQSFEPLADAVAAHARAAVLMGRDAPAIAHALRAVEVPVRMVDDLPAAVRAASALAQPGDIVLLSPACASFDAFRNYAHRAQVFVDAVRELPAGRAAGVGAVLPEVRP